MIESVVDESRGARVMDSASMWHGDVRVMPIPIVSLVTASLVHLVNDVVHADDTVDVDVDVDVMVTARD